MEVPQGIKEETFIQTRRRGGDGQPGWRGPVARQWLQDQGGQGSGWWTGWSHICVQISQGNNWGGKQTTQLRFPMWEKKASKPIAVKTCGDCRGRRNSQPHSKVHWRDPLELRIYTNPPTQESAPEGQNLFVGS